MTVDGGAAHPHPAKARPEGRASFRTPFGATFSPREKERRRTFSPWEKVDARSADG